MLTTCLTQYLFERVIPPVSVSVQLKNGMNKHSAEKQCCAGSPACQKPARIIETVARTVIKDNEESVF